MLRCSVAQQQNPLWPVSTSLDMHCRVMECTRSQQHRHTSCQHNNVICSVYCWLFPSSIVNNKIIHTFHTCTCSLGGTETLVTPTPDIP